MLVNLMLVQAACLLRLGARKETEMFVPKSLVKIQ